MFKVNKEKMDDRRLIDILVKNGLKRKMVEKYVNEDDNFIVVDTMTKNIIYVVEKLNKRFKI